MFRLPDIRYEDLKNEAADIIIQFQIKDWPIDVCKFSECLGLNIVYYEELDKHKKELCLKKSDDGIFSPNENIIYINQDKIYTRQRYTIVHEDMHYEAGHTNDSDENESEANFLAAYLLAPPQIMYLTGCFYSITDICSKFLIGPKCAKYSKKRYDNWYYFTKKYGLKEYDVKIINFYTNNKFELRVGDRLEKIK